MAILFRIFKVTWSERLTGIVRMELVTEVVKFAVEITRGPTPLRTYQIDLTKRSLAARDSGCSPLTGGAAILIVEVSPVY